jgi:hypothetical protein
VELSTYEFRYVVPHLVAANRYGQLDRLLRLETEDGANAWFDMKQRARKDASYDGDLALAEAGAARHRALSRVVQYSIMRSSLVSLAAAMPPQLVGALLRADVWSVRQAAAYAQRIPDGLQRAATYVEVGPCMVGTDQDEWYATAFKEMRVLSAEERARLIANVAAHDRDRALPELRQLLDDLAAQHSGVLVKRDHAVVVCAIANYLPAELIAPAVNLVWPDYPSVAIQLAFRLPQPERREAVGEILALVAEGAEKDGSPYNLSMCLAEALHRERVPGADILVARALDLERRRSKNIFRGETLVALTPFVEPQERPQLLEEALEALDLTLSPDRDIVLQLARSLPVALVRRVLNEFRTLPDEFSLLQEPLATLAVLLPTPERGELFAEALDLVARHASDAVNVRFPLGALAGGMDGRIREHTYQLALELADHNWAVEILRDLAISTPGADRIDLLSHAMKLVHVMKDRDHVAEALSQLAPILPHQLLPEATRAVRIDDKLYHARQIVSFTAHLTQRRQIQLLDYISQISAEPQFQREKIVLQMMPHLPPAAHGRVLTMLAEIEEPESRAEAIAQAAPNLTGAPRVRAIQALRAAADASPPGVARARSLAWLARVVGPEESVNVARRCVSEIGPIFDEETAAALALALPSLGPAEAARTVERVFHEAAERRHIGAMAGGLAAALPIELVREAIQLMDSSGTEQQFAHSLTSLLVRLAELGEPAIAYDLATGGSAGRWSRTRMHARFLRDTGALGSILARIARYLPGDLAEEAWGRLAEAGDEHGEARAALCARLVAVQTAIADDELVDATMVLPTHAARSTAANALFPVLEGPARTRLVNWGIKPDILIFPDPAEAEPISYWTAIQLIRSVSGWPRERAITALVRIASTIAVLDAKATHLRVFDAVQDASRWWP